jgi:hypothetical protein
MSLSPQALIRSLVQRALPSKQPDGASNDVAPRLFSYGELMSQPMVRKSHALADEGSYYTLNNAQAGIVPTYGTAFSATAPFLLLYNGQPAGGLNLAVDYAALVAIAAGACTTLAGYIAAAVTVDTGNRYTSGGTNLTPNIVNANLGASQTQTGVSAYCGAITATAASANARNLVGVRNLRPNVSSTVINVVGDMHLLNFGGVEGSVGSITIANANVMPQALPPLVIPPLCSALVYLWFPVMTAPSAATFAPELGFWLR